MFYQLIPQYSSHTYGFSQVNYNYARFINHYRFVLITGLRNRVQAYSNFKHVYRSHSSNCPFITYLYIHHHIRLPRVYNLAYQHNLYMSNYQTSTNPFMKVFATPTHALSISITSCIKSHLTTQFLTLTQYNQYVKSIYKIFRRLIHFTHTSLNILYPAYHLV